MTGKGTPMQWGISIWSPTTGSHEVETNREHVFLGKKSMKITQDSGHLERYGWSQNVQVKTGSTYTFSGYVKTSGVKADNPNQGASLYVMSGNDRFDSPQNLTGTND